MLLADPADLPTLCLVDKVFKELAETRLYKGLELSEYSRDGCLQTLSNRPDLSKHARRVAMRQAHDPEDLCGGYVTIYDMPNLTSLHIELVGSIGGHLLGCKFRLTFLVIVCDWDRFFVEWLVE